MHIDFCKQQIEFLTAAISLTQRDRLPVRKQRLSNLRHTRMMYLHQINICREAISPIHWIPDEVLGEIFLYCRPQDHHFSRESAPLLLCRVCTLWQEIATSTPKLWNHMSFWTPPFSNTDLMCYPVHRLNQWLLLSKDVNLSLFFEQGLLYHHIKLFAELILLAHYPRCRHLTIHLTDESAFGLIHFITLPPASLARLESLVLDGLNNACFLFEDTEPAITIFRESPKLRRLTTNNLEFVFNASVAIPQLDLQVLPWAQLTHLMVTDFVQVEVFVIVLAECSAIQFLRVSLDLADSNDEPLEVEEWWHSQRIVLPCLTEFHISVADGSCFPSMMDAFDFPALQCLCFRRSQDIDRLRPLDVFSWQESGGFTRQLRNLTQLSLIGRAGSQVEVLALLQSVPKLERLMLDIWTDYSAIIPPLFPFPDPIDHSTNFLHPFLRDLEVHIEQQDFPFPGDYITAAAAHSNFLDTFSVFCQPGIHCLRDLEDLCRSFWSCRLWTRFVIVGRGSQRFDVDIGLIDHENTNRSYNMF